MEDSKTKILVHGIDFNNYLAKSRMNSICVESWYTAMPNAEIKIWTEKDPLVEDWIKKSKWCQKAIELNKWEKVFEYIKNKILFHFGGIFLETDHYIFNDITKYGHNCKNDWAYFVDLYTSWTPSFYNSGNQDFVKICKEYDNFGSTKDDFFEYVNESYLGRVKRYRDKPIANKVNEIYCDFYHLFYSNIHKNKFWDGIIKQFLFYFDNISFHFVICTENSDGTQEHFDNVLLFWEKRINIISLLMAIQFSNESKKLNFQNIPLKIFLSEEISDKENLKEIIEDRFKFFISYGATIEYKQNKNEFIGYI